MIFDDNTKKMIVDKIEAIKSLKPYPLNVTVRNESEIEWSDGNPTNITDEQITAKQAELQAEYDSLAYARKREGEYPSTKNFMEAYTEKEIGGDSTKWDAYVINYNKVRTENPK
jgi:hypothetical protein